jgi:hypothetical protein
MHQPRDRPRAVHPRDRCLHAGRDHQQLAPVHTRRLARRRRSLWSRMSSAGCRSRHLGGVSRGRRAAVGASGESPRLCSLRRQGRRGGWHQ